MLLALLGRELWAKPSLESLLCDYWYCMTDMLIPLKLPATRFLLSLHLTLLRMETPASWDWSLELETDAWGPHCNPKGDVWKLGVGVARKEAFC